MARTSYSAILLDIRDKLVVCLTDTPRNWRLPDRNIKKNQNSKKLDKRKKKKALTNKLFESILREVFGNEPFSLGKELYISFSNF